MITRILQKKPVVLVVPNCKYYTRTDKHINSTLLQLLFLFHIYSIFYDILFDRMCVFWDHPDDFLVLVSDHPCLALEVVMIGAGPALRGLEALLAVKWIPIYYNQLFSIRTACTPN